MPNIAVIVPAHNEQEHIAVTVRSLKAQTLAPAVVIVVADNCTDLTAWAAQRAGAVVTTTVGNTARKAGALNHGIAQLDLLAVDAVATVDADTEVSPTFIENGWKVLAADPTVGGVTSVFTPRDNIDTNGPVARWLVYSQRVEFARAVSARSSATPHTMSGTGSLYSAAAVESVVRARGWLFDERPSNLVEDYETTLTLRDLGWSVAANRAVQVRTDAMTSVGDLWRQRLRWQRGTIDEWRRRGWTPSTRKSITVAALTLVLQLVTLALVAMAVGNMVVFGGRPPVGWLAPLVATSALAPIYNAYHARGAGRWAVVGTLVAVPDLAYNALRMAWWWRSLFLSFSAADRQW